MILIKKNNNQRNNRIFHNNKLNKLNNYLGNKTLWKIKIQILLIKMFFNN